MKMKKKYKILVLILILFGILIISKPKTLEDYGISPDSKYYKVEKSLIWSTCKARVGGEYKKIVSFGILGMTFDKKEWIIK